MEENKKISISSLNIDKFRELSDDELSKVIKSITCDAEIFCFTLMNAEAEMKGYDKECEEGHDFSGWGKFQYADVEGWATSMFCDPDGEPDVYEEEVCLCKRCAAVKRRNKNLIKDGSYKCDWSISETR